MTLAPRSRWKKILRLVIQGIRDFYVYFMLQLVLPVAGFLLSYVIPEKFRLPIIIATVVIPFLFILPGFIIYRLYDSRMELIRDLDIHKAVLEAIRLSPTILDEHFRVQKCIATYKIDGSDIEYQVRMVGKNENKDGTSCHELKFLTASDAENYQYAIQVFDNLRNALLDLTSEQLTPNTYIHSANMHPVKFGDEMDVTSKRMLFGAIARKKEYVFQNFSYLTLGVDNFSGTIFFDRKPTTFYVTTLDKMGKIVKSNIQITGREIREGDHVFQLLWRCDVPPDIVVINFEFPLISFQ